MGLPKYMPFLREKGGWLAVHALHDVLRNAAGGVLIVDMSAKLYQILHHMHKDEDVDIESVTFMGVYVVEVSGRVFTHFGMS
jgi:hypothetical protein